MINEKYSVGYYPVTEKDKETGEEKTVLRAHNPSMQKRFEKILREGIKRRAAEKGFKKSA